ncbi:MAG: SDR family oxidoreductase [Alcaligenaceae bacterium]|nr:SDR family oxidoreductase [Alcaligenaceae bacterium]
MNTAAHSDTRIAIVTGAAGGIGWATAQRLAADGCQLAILDLDGDAATQRAQELGPGHFGTGCDVASESSVQAAIAKVMTRFGRVDTLVNNAGIGDQSTGTIEQTAEGFDRVLSVHLRGTFLVSRDVGRIMLDQGAGAIVNLSSIAGLAGIPGRNAYAAAKAGISAMTRSMACEWARRGVRVNAVAPGYVRTVLVEKLEHDQALDTEAIAARTPMGRLARPEEIAQAIQFLVSEQSSFITGTTLNVDGGWLALGAPESALEAGAH